MLQHLYNPPGKKKDETFAANDYISQLPSNIDSLAFLSSC